MRKEKNWHFTLKTKYLNRKTLHILERGNRCEVLQKTLRAHLCSPLITGVPGENVPERPLLFVCRRGKTLCLDVTVRDMKHWGEASFNWRLAPRVECKGGTEVEPPLKGVKQRFKIDWRWCRLLLWPEQWDFLKNGFTCRSAWKEPWKLIPVKQLSDYFLYFLKGYLSSAADRGSLLTCPTVHWYCWWMARWVDQQQFPPHYRLLNISLSFDLLSCVLY